MNWNEIRRFFAGLMPYLVISGVVTTGTTVIADVKWNYQFPVGIKTGLALSAILIVVYVIAQVVKRWVNDAVRLIEPSHGFAVAGILMLIAAGIAANELMFRRWQDSVRASFLKNEYFGHFRPVWSVYANDYPLALGINLTPQKVTVYLSGIGYINLSNKKGECLPSVLAQPRTFCQSFGDFFITPGSSKIFPPLKLQFDRDRKTLQRIVRLDNNEVLQNASLEPPEIFQLLPIRALEKVEVKNDSGEKTEEVKEVFKQIQPTHIPVKIGRDVDRNAYFILMLLWSEDREFFEHNGISYRGVFRAVYRNTFRRADQSKQGSSTITSQTCKQIFSQGKDRSFSTKIAEFYCAAALESYLIAITGSKEAAKIKILETYINLVPLSIEKPDLKSGSGIIREEIIGFGTAAKLHLGKNLRDLNPAEAGSLVCAVPSPNRIASRKLLSERRKDLLKSFAGESNQKEYLLSFADEPVRFVYRADSDLKTDDALAQLTKKKMRELKIFAETNEQKFVIVHSTIDWQMQKILAGSIENQLLNFKNKVQKSIGNETSIEAQVDFVAMDSTSGEILNYLSLKTGDNGTLPNLQSTEDPFNPGSTIKPPLTAVMIDKKLWTMNTAVTPSECRSRDGWQLGSAPNYTSSDTVQNWLARSNNPFMICACRELTPEFGAQKIGQFFGRDPSTAAKLEEKRLNDGEHPCRKFLGISSDSIVSIFDLAAAYSPFPDGFRKQPTLFKRVSVDGEPVQLPMPHRESVLSPEAASIVAESLQQVALRKFRTKFNIPLFAKTGSTTFSYVFVVGSAKTVFVALLKIVPKDKKFDKKKVEKIFASDVAVPLMENALVKIAKNRPHWLSGNFRNNNVLQIYVKNGCVTNDGTGEVQLFLPGTEPDPCPVADVEETEP